MLRRSGVPREKVGATVFVGIAVSAAVLTACSAEHATLSPARAAVVFGAGITEVQDESINLAQQQLIEACMTKAGFRYQIAPWTANATGYADPMIINTANLRSNGFGLYQFVTSAPPKGHQGPAVDPNSNYLASLPAAAAKAWGTAMSGSKQVNVTLPDGKRFRYQSGGCYTESLIELYGNAKEYYSMQTYDADLTDKIRIETTWSNSYKHAMSGWTRCMRHHGLRYASMSAMVKDVQSRYAVPGASPAKVHQFELRVALQDASCIDAVKLNAVSARALAQAGSTLTGDQMTAILAWHEMENHALASATKILGQG